MFGACGGQDWRGLPGPSGAGDQGILAHGNIVTSMLIICALWVPLTLQAMLVTVPETQSWQCVQEELGNVKPAHRPTQGTHWGPQRAEGEVPF